jgi:hypothetical protein
LPNFGDICRAGSAGPTGLRRICAKPLNGLLVGRHPPASSAGHLAAEVEDRRIPTDDRGVSAIAKPEIGDGVAADCARQRLAEELPLLLGDLRQGREWLAVIAVEKSDVTDREDPLSVAGDGEVRADQNAAGQPATIVQKHLAVLRIGPPPR